MTGQLGRGRWKAGLTGALPVLELPMITDVNLVNSVNLDIVL